MLCYFAYPIDFRQGKNLSAIAQLAQRLHHLPNLAVYEPGLAWCVGADTVPDPRLQQVNDFALTRCDVVAAFLPDEVRSVGVPMEIQRAIDLSIPVVVLVENVARASWALVGSEAVIATTVEEWLRQIGELATYVELPPRQQIRLQPMMGCTGLAMPDRKHEGDAGFDLYVSEEVELEAGVSTNVRTHLAVELPHGVWGLIVGRSSTFHKRGLIVNTAVIDQGYRGELFASVFNPGEPVVISTGERLAQLIPMPLLAPTLDPVFVPGLSPSDRGEGGFGSTGQ